MASKSPKKPARKSARAASASTRKPAARPRPKTSAAKAGGGKAAKARSAKQPASKKAGAKKSASAPARATAPAKPKARPLLRAPRVRVQPETLRLRALSVSLTVDDLARSLAFYRDALGFIVQETWRDGEKVIGYMLRAGACEVGIGQDDWEKGHHRLKGVASRLWCETSQDVDAFADRVRAHGHPLTEEPRDTEWGVRVFSVDDPDGFHLSFFRKLGS